jgi:tetratricopeptide (TPR) repeat protein
MRSTLAPALLAALVLTGCATSPKVVDTSAREGRSAVAIARALELVETGSPSALRQAAALLSTDEARAAANAPLVASAARTLFAQLYPEIDNPLPDLPPRAVDAGVSPMLSRVLPVLAVVRDSATPDAATAARLLQDLSDADSLGRDSVLPPYLSGLLVQGSDHARARAFFEESLRRSPDFYPAAPRIAAIIIGDGTAAKELELLRSLAALLPTPSLRYAALTRAYLAAGIPAQAADTAAQGLLESPQDARFALLRAEALAASGDWYQALRVLDSLLKVKIDEPEALLLKARLLWREGSNVEEALLTLDDAESRYPADPAFVELRGAILLGAGREAEGVSALQKALTLAPDRVATLSLLLGHAVSAAAWDDALSWLEKIPATSRGADELRQGWQAATGKGDHAQALTFARALASLRPGPEPMLLEARSLLSMDEKTAALAAIDSALPAATDGTLRSDLFMLRSGAGSDDPLRDLRSALRENPDNGEALAAIAEILAAGKEYRKAMEYARRAAQLAPDDRALVDRLHELEALAAQ